PVAPGVQITCSPVFMFDHRMLFRPFPTKSGVARICQSWEIDPWWTQTGENVKPFMSQATTPPSLALYQRMSWRPSPLKSPNPESGQSGGTPPQSHQPLIAPPLSCQAATSPEFWFLQINAD